MKQDSCHFLGSLSKLYSGISKKDICEFFLIKYGGEKEECNIRRIIEKKQNKTAASALPRSLIEMQLLGPPEKVEKTYLEEFPGSPVARTLCFYWRKSGFNPWLRN